MFHPDALDSPVSLLGGSPNAKDTPNVKKRHRRAKSGANKGGGGGGGEDGNDSDGYEFIIVSIENKQWHFEAPSTEVRTPAQEFRVSAQGTGSGYGDAWSVPQGTGSGYGDACSVPKGTGSGYQFRVWRCVFRTPGYGFRVSVQGMEMRVPYPRVWVQGISSGYGDACSVPHGMGSGYQSMGTEMCVPYPRVWVQGGPGYGDACSVPQGMGSGVESFSAKHHTQWASRCPAKW